jgi:predicted PurR-regulated permease PerM
MAEVSLLRIPWATLWKVITAIALVWLWLRLWQLVMVVLVAIIIAVGLAPATRWLERRRWPRWAAAAVVTLVVFGAFVGFFALTWASLSDQARDVGGRIGELEQDVAKRVPKPLIELFGQAGGKPGASMIAPYAARLGREVVSGIVVFVLAFILVLYLLVEAELTYAWVRHFVPEKHRARFDQTAREAREVAFGFVVGNIITSIFAAAYTFTVLTALRVPAALLLSLLAFVCDFIPVVGFVVAVTPAILMAATVSGTLALAMIPVYLFYHFVENYFIAPRVYGARLELSKVAVLLAFAVGAELAGVIGALLALPLAAVFPTIERLWLRQARISQETSADE